MRRAPILGSCVIALAACGGGGEGTTGATPTTTGPVVTVTQPENTAQADPTPTGTPTFTVSLSAENATPVAGRPWRYTVTATGRGGAIAPGTTAKMRIFVGNELVDTLGFFSFEGTMTRTHRWPAVLKGKRDVVLQAEVEGDGGTQRTNLPITVG